MVSPDIAGVVKVHVPERAIFHCDAAHLHTRAVVELDEAWPTIWVRVVTDCLIAQAPPPVARVSERTL